MHRVRQHAVRMTPQRPRRHVRARSPAAARAVAGVRCSTCRSCSIRTRSTAPPSCSTAWRCDAGTASARAPSRPTARWTYARLAAHGQPDRARAGRRHGPRARQPRAAARLRTRRCWPPAGSRSSRRAAIVVATMPLLRAQGADRHRRQGARSRTRCATRGWPPSSTLARAALPDAAIGSRCFATDARGRPRRAGARQAGDFDNVRHRRRRHRADRVHVGHHRQAEGHDALPPRRDGDVRLLPASTCCAPSPDDVFIGTPPLAFTFGLGGLLLFPMRIGASTVLLEKATPDALLEAIARVPRHRLLHRADRRTARWPRTSTQHDLSSLRKCVSAGEALPAATRAALEGRDRHRDHRRHRRDRDAAHLHLASPRRCAARRHRQAGARLHARCVLDDDGEPLPPGQVGRLAVKGPTGCRYLDDERQANYVQDGWNLTGDAYLVDADGYFLYQARTDDMIISAGYNIAGPEVEERAAAAPGGGRMRRHRRARRGARADRQGLRRADAAAYGRRGDGEGAAGVREAARSRPTSIRARSSSATRCRAPRPASCSGSN